MKTLALLFMVVLISNVNSFASSVCEEPLLDDKVQVVCNSSTGKATITWSDSRIEFIEIVTSNGQFMPTIPVDSAKSLHMNDLMNGTYTLKFMSGGVALYTKTIVVDK